MVRGRDAFAPSLGRREIGIYPPPPATDDAVDSMTDSGIPNRGMGHPSEHRKGDDHA